MLWKQVVEAGCGSGLCCGSLGIMSLLVLLLLFPNFFVGGKPPQNSSDVGSISACLQNLCADHKSIEMGSQREVIDLF